jgi:hypothetical protein
MTFSQCKVCEYNLFYILIYKYPRGLRRGCTALHSWDWEFECHRGYGCLSVCLSVRVVCCQIEGSVSGWSPLQKSPTDCGVSERDREEPRKRRPWTRIGSKCHGGGDMDYIKFEYFVFPFPWLCSLFPSNTWPRFSESSLTKQHDVLSRKVSGKRKLQQRFLPWQTIRSVCVISEGIEGLRTNQSLFT